MKRFFLSLILTGGLVTLSVPSPAGEPEPAMDRQPVNIIAETGTNVGPCPGKGTLTYPPKPYKGRAFFLPRADVRIKAAHEAIASRELTWIHELKGPSDDNRMYLDGAGRRILVFSVCMDHQCDSNNLVGTFDLASGEYGLQINEQGRKRVLGSLSEVSRAAVACADSIDDRVRSEAAAAIRRQLEGSKK